MDLAKKGDKIGMIGKVLAVMFAIACIGGSFGGGCMVQINQATKQLISVTGGEASFPFRSVLDVWNCNGSCSWHDNYWWYQEYC